MIKQLKHFTLNLIAGANVATVLTMLATGYADRLYPPDHPLLSVLGLTFPIFLLLNLLFLLFWVVFKWRRLWIPVAGYLLAYPPIATYLPLNPRQDIPDGCIKVLTYNVCSYGGNYKYEDAFERILDYLKEQDADIVCLQEDVAIKPDSTFQLSHLYPYNDTVHMGNLKSSLINAVGVHSRYPILRKEKLAFDSNANGAAAFFLLIGHDTVCVVNLHLESTHLTNVDRKRYSDIISGDMDHNQAEAETRMIYGKLSAAMAQRARQADWLHNYIERHSRYPLIVCGDMNDTPISYVRRTVAQGLTDCYVESGCGLGFSYRRKGFRFRIDNIFCSSHFEPYNCYVDDTVEASDHYPVITWLHRQPAQ